ncbi:uncharacterized protein WM294_010042 [Sarcoramphus papa]
MVGVYRGEITNRKVLRGFAFYNENDLIILSREETATVAKIGRNLPYCISSTGWAPKPDPGATFHAPIARTPGASTHPWHNAADAAAAAGGSVGASLRAGRPLPAVPFQLPGGARPGVTEARSRGLWRYPVPPPAQLQPLSRWEMDVHLDSYISVGSGGLLLNQQQQQQQVGKDKGKTRRLRGDRSQRELGKWKKTLVVGTTGRTSTGWVGMGMQK